ncbi:hypothetical protein [Marivirga sp.]|uniref:hypothetical protein n=1 Tax=Marivirga sp. TaxID=2018662 RepID=UPI002D80C6D1|nr:hypothetical protein [Marivirga sp.]HET8858358.1 hypothetical protein [Marivirga sp.]
MQTIKTTAKMIALSLMMSFTINFTASAASNEATVNPHYSDAEMIKLLDIDSEMIQIEKELREEGILECENAEIIIVLGQDDEIVYQGSYQLEDENNAFLTRLLTKADFVMSTDGKSFYKVF